MFYWIAVSILLVGLVFRISDIVGSATLTLLGILGILMYSIFRTINDAFIRKVNLKNTLLWFAVALMCPILFGKYFRWKILDISAVIIVPIFLVLTAIYLSKEFRNKFPDFKLITVSVLFSLMIIPMFLTVERGPRKLILESWLPQNISDKVKRNENWCWFVDKSTGKGQWVPFANQRTIENGSYTYFFSNGKIRETGKIKNKENSDTSYVYDIYGSLIKYQFYRNDSIIDYFISNKPYILYHPTCKIKEEGTAENHKRGREYTFYYRSGKKCKESVLKDTLVIENFYLESGQKTYECISSLDMKYNITKWWFDGGQLASIRNMKNDLRHGQSQTWYENGNERFKGSYFEGKKHGKCFFYFEDGTLNTTGKYIADARDSTFLDYYTDGKKSIINYKDGLREGESIYFDSKGEIEKIEIYKNGVFTETTSPKP